MNEGGGGQVRDLSGYGNACTLNGETSWCVGRFGSALDLGGSGDYVGLDASLSLDTVADDPRTISAWIYPHTLPGYPYCYIISQGKSGAFDFHVRLSSGYLQAGNTDGASTCFPTALTLNQWQHVVVVFNSAGAIGYVNGRAGTLVNRKTKSSLSGNWLEIGRLMTGAGYFDGLIDHVMIYDRALSAQEVQRLYRDPFCMFARRSRPALAPKPKKTVKWWAGGVLETERCWLREALFNATTANGLKLGITLSGGWFWMRRSGCAALFEGCSMREVDFANLVEVTDADAGSISPPDYLLPENGTDHFYVLRRFNSCGYDERTLRAAVMMSLDQAGELCNCRPNGVIDARIEQADGNAARILWGYCPLGQQSPPAHFNIYYDGRTGQIDYANPLATVKCRGRGSYGYQSHELEPGRYLFAVCAEDEQGVESNSSAILKIEINDEDPTAIGIWCAESV